MRKILVLLFGALLLTGCGTTETKTSKEDAGEVKTMATGTDAKEIIEPPTERTVNTNGDMPWKYMTPEQIEEAQTNGEITYLFSDSEAIENYTSELASNPNTEPYNKEDLAASWSKHLGLYVTGVKEYYPEHEEYFRKIEEVKESMAVYDYESVIKKIEEAKTLRAN
jgi:hypothetical protein